MFEVLNQPQDGSIGYVLEETLANNKTNGFENFYFLVAYAKRSGVGRLSPFLKKFRDSGGKVTAVVGIDQKQTSFEALEELLFVSDNLFIFHNEIFTRTFHPKFYLFESPNNHAWILVGSSNLTGGGLYGNYEINSEMV
jgi:HKD family nuclease